MRAVALLWLCLGVLMVSACAASSTMSVRDPWVRAAVATGAQATSGTSADHHSTPGGGTSAAYFTLVNTSNQDDALIRVESDIATSIELHQTSIQDGIMRMRPVEEVVIPARGTVAFAPGGLHVMFVGLTRDLRAGETLTLTLHLRHAGTITVQAQVRGF